MGEFLFVNDWAREKYLGIVRPVGNLFARLGIHPNILSILGFLLSLAAGIVYSTGSFFWAAWIVVVGGTCDVLDGQLARRTGKNSPFGAFLDSTLDRFSEIAIFLGMAWHFAGGPSFVTSLAGTEQGHQSPLAVALVLLTLGGSLMVSYTRARAEGLGIDCKVGLMQRPERIVLLIIGSLLYAVPAVGPVLIKSALFMIAVLAHFTAFQRMAHVRRRLRQEE